MPNGHEHILDGASPREGPLQEEQLQPKKSAVESAGQNLPAGTSNITDENWGTGCVCAEGVNFGKFWKHLFKIEM